VHARQGGRVWAPPPQNRQVRADPCAPAARRGNVRGDAGRRGGARATSSDRSWGPVRRLMSAHKQRLRVPLRVTTTLRWRPDWPFAVIVAAAWIALLTGPSWHANHGHTNRELTTLERP